MDKPVNPILAESNLFIDTVEKNLGPLPDNTKGLLQEAFFAGSLSLIRGASEWHKQGATGNQIVSMQINMGMELLEHIESAANPEPERPASTGGCTPLRVVK